MSDNIKAEEIKRHFCFAIEKQINTRDVLQQLMHETNQIITPFHARGQRANVESSGDADNHQIIHRRPKSPSRVLESGATPETSVV